MGSKRVEEVEVKPVSSFKNPLDVGILGLLAGWFLFQGLLQFTSAAFVVQIFHPVVALIVGAGFGVFSWRYFARGDKLRGAGALVVTLIGLIFGACAIYLYANAA